MKLRHWVYMILTFAFFMLGYCVNYMGFDKTATIAFGVACVMAFLSNPKGEVQGPEISILNQRKSIPSDDDHVQVETETSDGNDVINANNGITNNHDNAVKHTYQRVPNIRKKVSQRS